MDQRTWKIYLSILSRRVIYQQISIATYTSVQSKIGRDNAGMVKIDIS